MAYLSMGFSVVWFSKVVARIFLLFGRGVKKESALIDGIWSVIILYMKFKRLSFLPCWRQMRLLSFSICVMHPGVLVL